MSFRLLKLSVKFFLRLATRLLPSLPGFSFLLDQFLEVVMSEHKTIEHNGIKLAFSTPNSLCRYRVNTFSTKEPSTLLWLEGIPEDSVFWDIGANVGLYSIYAAAQVHARVFAFEPSVFNLEILARNIFLNRLHHRITIFPFALADTLGPSLFNMSTTTWGGALSTFGKDTDQHGGRLNTLFEYQTMGLTIDEAVQLLHIPPPRFIKIDVDGLEHFILRGGVHTLKTVESILIEIDDHFSEQAEESSRHLHQAGLTLYRKCDGYAFRQYNQWWVRANL